MTYELGNESHVFSVFVGSNTLRPPTAWQQHLFCPRNTPHILHLAEAGIIWWLLGLGSFAWAEREFSRLGRKLMLLYIERFDVNMSRKHRRLGTESQTLRAYVGM